MEPLEDFSFEGRRILASRLGYRITELFVHRFLGRLFETPDAVFPAEMLRPEKQSRELFAGGVDAIVEAQRRVALNYFEDGSIEAACPPLKALLHMMAHASYQGMQVADAEFRKLFDRQAVLASEWYAERLSAKQRRDIALWNRHAAALESFRRSANQSGIVCEFNIEERIAATAAQRERVNSRGYLDELRGTIGADPFLGQIPRSSL